MGDTKRVDKSLRSAWPPGTFDAAAAPGHQAQPPRGRVAPAPSRKGKRGKQRKAT